MQFVPFECDEGLDEFGMNGVPPLVWAAAVVLRGLGCCRWQHALEVPGSWAFRGLSMAG